MILPEGQIKNLEPTLRQWKAQSRVPPTLLLTGPSGIGKKETALYLSKWLLCERVFTPETATQDLFAPQVEDSQESTANQDQPCGECRNCLQMEKKISPDLTIIEPDQSGTGSGKIKIDSLREVKTGQGFAAVNSAHRVVLIDHAEDLTPQAANSLLKILEEPPRTWVFILTAENASLLLPTIVSRCQQIRVLPLPTQEIEALLNQHQIPKERSTPAARLSQGSFKRAFALVEDDCWEKRRLILSFVDTPAEHLNKVVDWASKDRKQTEFLIDQLEGICRDLVMLTTLDSRSDPDNIDAKRTLKKALENTRKRFPARSSSSSQFWIRRSEDLAKTRSRVDLPLNKKLLVQDLLIPWLEIG